MRGLSFAMAVGMPLLLVDVTSGQGSGDLSRGPNEDYSSLRPPAQALVEAPLVEVPPGGGRFVLARNRDPYPAAAVEPRESGRASGVVPAAVRPSAGLTSYAVPRSAVSSSAVSHTMVPQGPRFTSHHQVNLKPACTACSARKASPIRNVLDRVSSGMDYLFFGVTSVGKPTNCVACDGLADCDSGLLAAGLSKDGESPMWESVHAQQKKQTHKEDLRAYFDMSPYRSETEGLQDVAGGTQAIGGPPLDQEVSTAPSARPSEYRLAPVPTLPDMGPFPISEPGTTPTGIRPPQLPVALPEVSQPAAEAEFEPKRIPKRPWTPPTDPFTDDPVSDR